MLSICMHEGISAHKAKHDVPETGCFLMAKRIVRVLPAKQQHLPHFPASLAAQQRL